MGKRKTVRRSVGLTDAEIKRATERGKWLDDEPKATEVEYRPGSGLDLVIVKLSDGSRRAIPREDLQGLESGTRKQLSRIEIVGRGTGLHWPDLDADIYVPALLRGIYGTKAWMAKIGPRDGWGTTAARERKEKEFFKLAKRYRASKNPKEAKELGDELGRLVFGE